MEIPQDSQTFVLGGQQLYYSGDDPLHIEPGVYWDTPPATAHTVVAVDSAGPRLVVEPGPTDEVRFIVQLDSEPVAARKVTLETSDAVRRHAANLRVAQASVLTALEAQNIPVRVQHQYVYAYHGLAITARAGDRETIAKTPGVRAVYPDYEVHALLPESVPLIGAPTVWAMQDPGGQPVIGTNVRVAVIDSGIDYNHPDLGGPGFPNARVITGYNVISDTVDPWDDYGHGTHCAGIAGASGHLTGVAPATSLMAYKVFDANGNTSVSVVIAGIERALDPDGNPGTDDSAHVISLSLGDLGDPDDPLSQACDNAVQAGAVVVVAGGNSGPRYQTITSPGVARQVLTVGATNKYDSLASFSSRGPVPGSWAIKPDVVAPGVEISSTIPGGYTYGGGTSAAAPHVAGAAVLLRQLHPAWSPAFVRAALMNTALDLGWSPYEQGAGRIQADQATNTPAIILPPSLNLGRVDPSQPIWNRQEMLDVQNVSTSTVTYTLSIAGSLPVGVTTDVSPTQVIVPPDNSASVTFTLSVDTATVPDRQVDPFAYWGALLATSAGSLSPTLRVPFAFIKAPLVRLHVDDPIISVMFVRHGEPLRSRFAWPGTLTSDHLLTAGTYDVVVQYRQPYAYVARTITLTDYVEMTVSRGDANHQVRIAFTDEAAQPATPNHAFHRFMWSGNGWLVSETTAVEPITETFSFSDVPTYFVWERTVACANPADVAYRQWHGRAEGISGDMEFLTDQLDFAPINHPLRSLPGAITYNLNEWIGYATSAYAYRVAPTVPTITVPYERRAYYRTPPPGHELYMLRTAVVEPAGDAFEGSVMSPWLQLDTDRRLAWRQPSSQSGSYYRVPSGGAEPLGLGPIHCFAQFANDGPDSIRIIGAEGKLYYRAYQGGDVSLEMRQPYELWQDGTWMQTGDIGPDNGRNYALISLPVSGTYSMTMPFTYTLGATDVVTAHGRVVAEFDTTRYETDASPPFVKVLRVLQNGQPVDVASGPVELHLVISDAVDVAPAVTAAYDVGDGWAPVTVTQTAHGYVAPLPGFDDGAAVHLRIVTADASGNVMTHYLEPAYLVRWRRMYLPVVYRNAL